MVFTFFCVASYHVHTYQHIMSTLNKSCYIGHMVLF